METTINTIEKDNHLFSAIKNYSFENNDNITKYNDYCEDICLNNIPANLHEIELQIDRLKRKWNEFTYLIGQRLKYINDNKLYEEKGYSNFGTYVKVALQMSENNAYYYIAVFDYFTEEQTQIAGSKLKLIIPVLNKIKKDKSLDDYAKTEKINKLKSELYYKICHKTYREAENIIKDIRKRYFKKIIDIKPLTKISAKNDRIIIFEKDKDIQNELIKIINDFYKIV